MGDATKLDLEAWNRDMRINVTSMVLMARHCIPEMVGVHPRRHGLCSRIRSDVQRKNSYGAIVNMSLVSGRMWTRSVSAQSPMGRLADIL